MRGIPTAKGTERILGTEEASQTLFGKEERSQDIRKKTRKKRVTQVQADAEPEISLLSLQLSPDLAFTQPCKVGAKKRALRK